MRFLLLCLCLLVALPGCATKSAVNTDLTAANTSEQLAGGAYGTYIAADTAWLAYLTTAKPPSRALIASVEPKRKAARAALDAFADAAVRGDAAAEQVAYRIALKALIDTMTAGGVPAAKGT